MKQTIDVGYYIWERNIPIPKCDSCNKHDATWKVYTEKSGIRLCESCKSLLSRKLPREEYNPIKEKERDEE